MCAPVYLSLSQRADLALKTEVNQSGNFPESLTFSCQRTVSCIDQEIGRVYSNAINGLSHLDMHESPLVCQHNEVAGGCGNRRNHLSECRCQVLDRRTRPEIRHHYENLVLAKIGALLNQRTQSGTFKLNLAIFCSGGLLGEEILLFKLFNQIRSNNLTGDIHISFIDTVYQQAITNSFAYHKYAHVGGQMGLDGLFGKDPRIQQFLTEICQCLPPSITFSGHFFGSDNGYISSVASGATCRHDLLIGADIVGLMKEIQTIEDYAGTGAMTPLVLDKDGAEKNAIVCNLDHNSVPHCSVLNSAPKKALPASNQAGCIIM